MKSLPVLLLAIVWLTGCSRNVQVVTLRGNNVMPTTKGLVLDNDTLTLQYDFSSERGRMHLSVVNKLNQPLYIDWKRSSLIVGQDKVDYWHDVANVQLTTYGNPYNRYAARSTSGTISKDDPVSFIPPKTRVDKHKFVVVPNGTLRLSGTPAVVQEKPKWNPDRKKPVDVSTFTYGDDQSPLTFRNYLTLSTDKDFKTEFHIDTQFWASDVKVMPYNQLVSLPVRQSDGTYSQTLVFNKPDGFYVPIPFQ